jgi:hypothetical protein
MSKVPVNNSMIYFMVSNLGHTIETAVADLLDNSIQFGAKNFRFGFYYDDINPKNSFLYFFDDGKGMDEKELSNAMTIGSEQNKKFSIHSKFGLGLKIASLSNCDYFQVFSQKDSGKVNSMRMFYDKTKENLLTDSETKIPEKFDKIFPSFKNTKSGTLIIWSELKKNKFKVKSHSDFFSISSKIQSHLMLTFHRYIENKKISIFYNDEMLECINPTIPSLNTTKIDTCHISIDNEKVDITGFAVPSDENYNLSKENTKKTKSFFNSNSMDGIYLYRNDRLIDFGKWYDVISDSFRSKNIKKIKRLRLVINFNEKLDKNFSLEPTKSELELPHELTSAVYDIYDKLYKKISTHSKASQDKKEIISSNKNLWTIKNGKPCINYDSEEVSKLIKNNKKLENLLKEIERSIPMIVTHDIRLNDLNLSESTLINRAVNAINNLSKQGHELRDSIELISSRRPFIFEDGLKDQLMEHFNV